MRAGQRAGRGGARAGAARRALLFVPRQAASAEAWPRNFDYLSLQGMQHTMRVNHLLQDKPCGER